MHDACKSDPFRPLTSGITIIYIFLNALFTRTPRTVSDQLLFSDLPASPVLSHEVPSEFDWKKKAQQRISQTKRCTVKVMKQKWQRLAKLKPVLGDSRVNIIIIS